MKNITLILALLIVFSIPLLPLFASTPAVPWFTQPKQGEDPLYDSPTREKLKTLKVSVQWSNISLETALRDLTLRSKEVDPAHQGIQFTSKLPSEGDKVSLILADTSLDDVLAYLSEQTNLRFQIHKDEVMLLPRNPTSKPGQ